MSTWSRSMSSVYPRACGGTPNHSRHHRRYLGLSPRLRGTPTNCHKYHIRWGLSPRLRGNLVISAPLNLAIGSIPALAGEPTPDSAPTGKSTVYPRACGGTTTRTGLPPTFSGLSPRLRGNRACLRLHPPRRRSIPALAGEPPQRLSRPPAARVYPRACGGTGLGLSRAGNPGGLSPRLRGNPVNPWGSAITEGSIPALAGEPPVSHPHSG